MAEVEYCKRNCAAASLLQARTSVFNAGHAVGDASLPNVAYVYSIIVRRTLLPYLRNIENSLDHV